MSLPSECGSFKVIILKIKETSPIEHYIFAKEHAVREVCPLKPPDKTIFILGVPPFVTEALFSEMFSQFWNVRSVYFHTNPDPNTPLRNESLFFKDHPEVKGYKVAYIVFDKSSSVDKAMSIDPDEKLILMPEDQIIPLGIPKWCKEYNKCLVNPSKIQKEIDEYMEKHDKKVEEEAKRLKEVAEPDEEGWVTVTKKARKPAFARKESVHNKIMKKEKIKTKKKQLLNFYRFQIRESKMNQLIKLREKFEEDKKKIEQMKQSRKFKPF